MTTVSEEISTEPEQAWTSRDASAVEAALNVTAEQFAQAMQQAFPRESEVVLLRLQREALATALAEATA